MFSSPVADAGWRDRIPPTAPELPQPASPAKRGLDPFPMPPQTALLLLARSQVDQTAADHAVGEIEAARTAEFRSPVLRIVRHQVRKAARNRPPGVIEHRHALRDSGRDRVLDGVPRQRNRAPPVPPRRRQNAPAARPAGRGRIPAPSRTGDGSGRGGECRPERRTLGGRRGRPSRWTDPPVRADRRSRPRRASPWSAAPRRWRSAPPRFADCLHGRARVR